MKKLKNKKGITLIALVITIVVLLILAGVTIAMLTGDNGILTKAQTSKTKSEEEEAREKVSLMLAEWKIDNATDAVTIQEYLESTSGKYYNQIKAQGIESITKSEEGLYYAYVIIGGQDYYVEIYIGNAGEVTIGEVLTSLNVIMFGGNMEPQYVFSGNVEVTITATAPEGKTITNIETEETGMTSGDMVGSGTQTASRTFTLVVNDDNEMKYRFIATDNQGETKGKIITIKTLPKPEIEVTKNVTDITINVVNSEKYPEGTKFKYYVGDDDTTGTEITENLYTKTGLIFGTTYNNIKVKAYYGTEENGKESEAKSISLDAPEPTLSISDVTIGSFKVNVTNSESYPTGTIFKYYIGENDTTGVSSNDALYTATNLAANTNYNVKVEIIFNDNVLCYNTCSAKTQDYQLSDIPGYGKGTYLFNNGPIDGIEWNGWCAVGDSTLGSGSIENNVLKIETTGYCGYVMSTANKIDLSQFSKIVLKIDTISGSPVNLSAFLQNTESSYNAGQIKDLANSQDGSYVEVEINNISDSRYIGLTTAWSTKLHVSQVFLVK